MLGGGNNKGDCGVAGPGEKVNVGPGKRGRVLTIQYSELNVEAASTPLLVTFDHSNINQLVRLKAR